MKTTEIASLIALCVAATGCGLKGNLYIPAEPGQAAETAVELPPESGTGATMEVMPSPETPKSETAPTETPESETGEPAQTEPVGVPAVDDGAPGADEQSN